MSDMENQIKEYIQRLSELENYNNESLREPQMADFMEVNDSDSKNQNYNYKRYDNNKGNQHQKDYGERKYIKP